MDVWGHRGKNTVAHLQNSLSSLGFGLKSSHGIETDCVVSKDGTIYLIHDMVAHKLKKIIKPEYHDVIGERRMDELSDKEINSFRLINDEKIPTLEEFLTLASHYQNKVLNLELKSDDIAENVLGRVAKTAYGKTNKIVYSSFNHSEIITLKTLSPEANIGLLYAPDTETKRPMHPWKKTSEGFYIPILEHEIDTDLITQLKPNYLNIEATSYVDHAYKFLNKKYPDMPIILWTFGIAVKAHKDTHLLQQLKNPKISKNVTAIIVDYPAKMVKALNLTAPK